MKKLLLVVVMLIGCITTQAQKKISVEVSAGLTYPMKGNDKSVGPAFALEGRYNVGGGLDAGLQAYYGDVIYSHSKSKEHSKTIGGLVVADYNIGLNSSFTPFLGAGVGYGQYKVSYLGAEEKTKGMLYMLRIGVEHKSHVRLTLYGRMGKEYFASYGLSVGYAF